MFTIKIVQTFSNESVYIRKKKKFKNASFGFQILNYIWLQTISYFW